MHLAPLIRDLAVILGVAAVVSFIFQRIRQPVVLGYIVAGMIVGPYTPPRPLVTDIEGVRIWAELGVIFLMFSLGLEFSFRRLMRVGVSAVITGILEMSFMMALGSGCGLLLGWDPLPSLFLGGILAISSTTIIIRALDELGVKSRRFAEVILGVLIVEDLAAILILVALSTIAASRTFSGLALVASGGRLALVVSAWFLAGYFVVPGLVKRVGRKASDEMLALLAVALCLLLVVFADRAGYSVALGAFIMGSILSESTESRRIEERIVPLRDLFAAVFFVSVGMLVDPAILREDAATIALLTLLLVVGKISAITVASIISGQTFRTAVQVGFGMAQIGEFSFIIAGLATTLKVVDVPLTPIAVAVSIVTTFLTPYLIRVSHKVAVRTENALPGKLRAALTRYSVWVQERRIDAARRKEFYGLLMRWLASGVLVSVCFVLVGETGIPLIARLVPDSNAVAVLGWAAAALLSAPFIWAMLSLFKSFRTDNAASGDQPPRGGTLMLMRAASLLWIGALSLEFFPARYAVLMTAGFLGFFFFAFYRQLGASYHWFERRFLTTFEKSDKAERRRDLLRHLAPWDAHLVRIKIHPNSEVVLKTIGESHLRNKFGVNVVAIQRGVRTLVAPQPGEFLLPKDELLMLGTDEQIETVRPWLEKPPGVEERFRELSGYDMRPLLVAPASSLVGKTIRESGIREVFSAMVVGLERAEKRNINPDSDLPMREGDVLWVVGEKDRLDALMAAVVPTAS